MERKSEILSLEEDSLREKVLMALARLQGGVDKDSKEILKKESFSLTPEDLEGASIPEKALMGAISSILGKFLGDGSRATTLLGQSVLLTEEDRGLFALRSAIVAVSDDVYSSEGDWEDAALLFAAVSKGQKFEDIYTRLKKKTEGFIGAFGTLLKTQEIESDEMKDTESGIEEVLNKLMTIYGSSFDNFLANKNNLEKEIKEKLIRQISLLSQAKLNEVSQLFLNGDPNNPMLDTTLKAGREVLVELLTAKKEDLNSTLNLLRS